MSNLKDILKNGRIVMFGYSDKNLPIDLNIQDEKFYVYNKKPNELIGRSYEKYVRKYFDVSEISRGRSNLVFLDNEAAKV